MNVNGAQYAALIPSKAASSTPWTFQGINQEKMLPESAMAVDSTCGLSRALMYSWRKYEPGLYELILEAEGYDTLTHVVRLAEDETTRVEVTMERKP